MPLGKSWDKAQHTWVPVETTIPIDYTDSSIYDEDSWGLLLSFFRQYPDYMLDIFQDPHSKYNLELIQRINIRAFCRFEEVDITGSRGTTKTYTIFLAALCFGILYPGVIKRYFGPTQKQAAQLASDTFKEISENYPLLTAHWRVVSDAQERFEIKTDYGSEISITAMRGDNAHGVIAEETSQAESGQAFDHEKFRSAVLPAIRLRRMIDREVDENCPQFQKLYIQSAGTQQNPSFEYRQNIFKDMVEGKSAFCIDYPGEIAVLSGIRAYSWYEDLKRKLTPEEWLREMCSIYTGTSENPVVRDSVLTESRSLMVMENRHCGNPNVAYIIGYDVSYMDGSNNAKCATSVCKLERQKGPFKFDKYLKQFVYMLDEPPPRESMMQAKKLKERWARFCMDGGGPTYIAIDAAAYGKSVVEDLHKDLNDGLPPLCCMNHELRELELEGALPVIYPIRATAGFGGQHDPDSEMLRYAEIEWDQGNVKLLVNNVFEGVQAYKRYHKIKEDSLDAAIALPYLKTKEFCGQVANLMKKPSGTGMRETRISSAIQRDMWSATKYALRVAQILERDELVNALKRESPWTEQFAKPQTPQIVMARAGVTPRVVSRNGGNMH